MAVEIYSYLDASAPVMNGSANSIITLLDAILVNGYGSKAAAGWTKAYTGTNKAAYRMAATLGARGYYLRIADGGDTNRSFQAQGYSAMTTIDAGTNKMPMAGQINSTWDYQYLVKSQTSDTTARPWYAVADNRGIFLFWDSNGTTSFSAMYYQYLVFAQCEALALGDPGPIFMAASTSTAYTSTDVSKLASISYVRGTPDVVSRHVTSESFSGLGPSAQCGKVFRGWAGGGNSSFGGSYGVSIPNPFSGSIDIAQMHIWEPSVNGNKGMVRAPIPYLFALDHVLTGINETYCSANLFQTFSGTGSFAGKTFMIIPAPADSSMYYMAVQISGAR